MKKTQACPLDLGVRLTPGLQLGEIASLLYAPLAMTGLGSANN